MSAGKRSSSRRGERQHAPAVRRSAARAPRPASRSAGSHLEDRAHRHAAGADCVDDDGARRSRAKHVEQRQPVQRRVATTSVRPPGASSALSARTASTPMASSAEQVVAQTEDQGPHRHRRRAPGGGVRPRAAPRRRARAIGDAPCSPRRSVAADLPHQPVAPRIVEARDQRHLPGQRVRGAAEARVVGAERHLDHVQQAVR